MSRDDRLRNAGAAAEPSIEIERPGSETFTPTPEPLSEQPDEELPAHSTNTMSDNTFAQEKARPRSQEKDSYKHQDASMQPLRVQLEMEKLKQELATQNLQYQLEVQRLQLQLTEQRLQHQLELQTLQPKTFKRQRSPSPPTLTPPTKTVSNPAPSARATKTAKPAAPKVSNPAAAPPTDTERRLAAIKSQRDHQTRAQAQAAQKREACDPSYLPHLTAPPGRQVSTPCIHCTGRGLRAAHNHYLHECKRITGKQRSSARKFFWRKKEEELDLEPGELVPSESLAAMDNKELSTGLAHSEMKVETQGRATNEAAK